MDARVKPAHDALGNFVSKQKPGAAH
jgi:hypothetical protein